MLVEQTECDNFESGYLRLAAHESLTSGKYWLAIEALKLTLETEKMLLDGAMNPMEEGRGNEHTQRLFPQNARQETFCRDAI